MTPEESAQLISRLFGVIDAGHYEDLGQVFAENIVYARPGYPAIKGLDKLTDFYEKVRIIKQGEHRVDHITGTGCAEGEGRHALACWGRFTGETREGSGVEEDFADTYIVENGLIVERKTFFYRPAV